MEGLLPARSSLLFFTLPQHFCQIASGEGLQMPACESVVFRWPPSPDPPRNAAGDKDPQLAGSIPRISPTASRPPISSGNGHVEDHRLHLSAGLKLRLRQYVDGLSSVPVL